MRLRWESVDTDIHWGWACVIATFDMLLLAWYLGPQPGVEHHPSVSGVLLVFGVAGLLGCSVPLSRKKKELFWGGTLHVQTWWLWMPWFTKRIKHYSVGEPMIEEVPDDGENGIWWYVCVVDQQGHSHGMGSFFDRTAAEQFVVNLKNPASITKSHGTRPAHTI